MRVLPVRVRIAPWRGRLFRRGIQRHEHGGEAAGEVYAVVGVADRRVQLGQAVPVDLDDLGGGRDPGPEDFSVHGGSLTDNLENR
jgi:hypothetical protein